VMFVKRRKEEEFVEKARKAGEHLRKHGMKEAERLKKEISELREELNKKKPLREKLKTIHEKMAVIGQRADSAVQDYLLVEYTPPAPPLQDTEPVRLPSLRELKPAGLQLRDLFGNLSNLFSSDLIRLEDIDDLILPKNKKKSSSFNLNFSLDIDELVYGKRKKKRR